MGDFLFGSSGTAPQAFRSPGWQNQGELLNQLFVGNALASNPGIGEANKQKISSIEQEIARLQGLMQPAGNFQPEQRPFSRYNAGASQGPQQPYYPDPNKELFNQISGLQGDLSGLKGFQSQVDAFSGNQSNLLGGFDTQLPAVNFTQRVPYQFSQSVLPNVSYNPVGFDAAGAVGDAFTPAAQALQNQLRSLEGRRVEDFNEDINRRGLYQSGAALSGVRDIQRDFDETATNALLNLASQQAGQQLGASQFGANLAAQQGQFGANFQAQQNTNQAQLNQQREINQAAEIFRNQGATDEQALALANQALQQRGLQFQKAQFQNQLSRQPLDDLLRLYSLSTGGTPGTPGQPGLLQGVAGGLGSAVGGLIF